MRLQIEPTETIMTADGVKCRVWNGVSPDGVPCIVLVHRIILWTPEATPPGAWAEFERELQVIAPAAELSVAQGDMPCPDPNA